MTLNPYITSPFSLLIDAYKVMSDYEIRRLPVLNEDNMLVGIITLSDIRSLVAVKSLDSKKSLQTLAETQVEKIMSPNTITIDPDAPLSEAAQLMFENKIGGLPVVKNDRLVGIISESDLFQFVISIEHIEYST